MHWFENGWKDSGSKEKLITRMGEVTGYRAAKWIEELNKVSQRSPKDQLLERLEEASEILSQANKSLC